MGYNHENISAFMHRVVNMKYRTKDNVPNDVNGVITASTEHNIVFDINGEGNEQMLSYSHIKEIKKLI